MAVRARRQQRGWRLIDLAEAAGVGATACSDLERGRAGEMSVRAVRSICDAVELPVSWDVGWQRQLIDRLLDADHSALASLVTRRLERLGWTARAEVSFNRYGERGRIDLLAVHPAGTVLVVELKTIIVDGQELIGGVDAKARIAPFIARQIGWAPRQVVPAIIAADSTTARRHVKALAPLLSRYSLRGTAALAWLRAPVVRASGLLMLTKLPNTAGADARRAGRRRIRPGRGSARSTEALTRAGKPSAAV
jgi:transcriptional regulator with XRE-family HTH domain